MTNLTEDEIMALNEALANDRNYTVEYLDTLPEHVRAEVIDGRLFSMAAPTKTHQKLLFFLVVLTKPKFLDYLMKNYKKLNKKFIKSRYFDEKSIDFFTLMCYHGKVLKT